MKEYALQYAKNHCGRVAKVKDYGFLFEELDLKHFGEVKRTYWVMKSYFYEVGR